MKSRQWVRGVFIVACSLSLAGAFVAYRGGWLQAAPTEGPATGYVEVKVSNLPPHWSAPKSEEMFVGSKSMTVSGGSGGSIFADHSDDEPQPQAQAQLVAPNQQAQAANALEPARQARAHPTTRPATQPRQPDLMPGSKAAPAFR